MKCKYKYKNWPNKDKHCPHEAESGSDYCIWHQNIDGKDFRGKKIKEKNLQESYLVKANLENTEFKEKTNLSFSNLQEANLRLVRLQKSNLFFANLQRANLTKTRLQEADLRYAELQGANLRLARLQEADLRRTRLQGANLQYARLQGANLRGANLQGALFWATELWDADVREAKLKGAIFYETKIKETINFEYTVILDAQNEKKIIQEILGEYIIFKKKQPPNKIVTIKIEDLVDFKPDIFSEIKPELRKEFLASGLIHFFYKLDSGGKQKEIETGRIEGLSKKCYSIINSAGSPIDKTNKIKDQVEQFMKEKDNTVYEKDKRKIEFYIINRLQIKLQKDDFPKEKFEKIKEFIVKNYEEFLKKELYTENDDYLILANRCYIDTRDAYIDLKNRFKEHGDYDNSGRYFIAEFKVKRTIYKIQFYITLYKMKRTLSPLFKKLAFCRKEKNLKDPNETHEKSFFSLLKWSFINLFNLSLNKLLFITSSYGESTWKVVMTSALTIAFFGLLYFFSRGVAVVAYSNSISGFWSYLYFSVVTFTTLGYGDFYPMPYMRVAAGIEAFMGAFLIGYFVVVIGRKIMR